MAKIIKMHPSGNQGENDKNAPTSPIADFLNFLHSEMQNGHKSTLFDNEDEFDDNDEFNDDDEGLLDDEAYLIGEKLPKQKFLGKSVREFHIRIKLNYASTKIWRELVVPSNITLELLAYVLIQAMGWHHEHLFQFKGKHDTYYINSREFKEHRDSFFGFFSPVNYRNSEKTSLDMVLQPKGERLKFEYDFGDSWEHDLWVKAAREYAADEEPVIRVLKAKGACPPEDCGGVWGYEELIELSQKKRKSADDKNRLEWYDIPNNFDPDECDQESLQDNVEALWKRIKKEM